MVFRIFGKSSSLVVFENLLKKTVFPDNHITTITLSVFQLLCSSKNSRTFRKPKYIFWYFQKSKILFKDWNVFGGKLEKIYASWLYSTSRNTTICTLFIGKTTNLYSNTFHWMRSCQMGKLHSLIGLCPYYWMWLNLRELIKIRKSEEEWRGLLRKCSNSEKLCNTMKYLYNLFRNRSFSNLTQKSNEIVCKTTHDEF